MTVTRNAVSSCRTTDEHYPGTYRAGCYNRAGAEVAGEDLEIEALVNLPSWLPLSIRFDGGPWLALGEETISDYRDELDQQTGMTRREFTFRDEQDRRTRVSEQRLVSMAEPDLMAVAVWTLCHALEVLKHLSSARREELWAKLELTREELSLWEKISRRMRVVLIISQFEGFNRLAELSPDDLPERLAGQRVDWALEPLGKSADDYQLTKQADVLTLFYLLPGQEVCGLLNRLRYPFSLAQIRRNADYYLAGTTHRSGLSRIVYAGAVAEVDLQLSWQLYQEALGTDLCAFEEQGVQEGVHLGAMGGTLDVLQRRYLGLMPDRDAPAGQSELAARLGQGLAGTTVPESGDRCRGRLRQSADPLFVPEPVPSRLHTQASLST